MNKNSPTRDMRVDKLFHFYCTEAVSSHTSNEAFFKASNAIVKLLSCTSIIVEEKVLKYSIVTYLSAIGLASVLTTPTSYRPFFFITQNLFPCIRSYQ